MDLTHAEIVEKIIPHYLNSKVVVTRLNNHNNLWDISLSLVCDGNINQLYDWATLESWRLFLVAKDMNCKAVANIVEDVYSSGPRKLYADSWSQDVTFESCDLAFLKKEMIRFEEK